MAEADISNEVANSVHEVSDELKSEDTVRELYSNVTSVKEKVQYPLFEEEETKAELLRGNGETKIKELLEGSPKNHIPDTMENTDDIYRAMDKVFWDSMRLLDYETKSLTKFGTIPSYNTKG